MDNSTQLLRRFTLALCVWREARSESLLGKMLVAQVIENRVNDKRWPDTYVGVITQPLQFSAFNRTDPQVSKFPAEDDKEWPDCVAASDLVLNSPKPLTSANHYHTKNVHPSWADPLHITNTEGAHIFYEL